MNLLELKQTVMFQTNNDADDLGDFMPYVTDYLNQAYDRLTMVWAGQHVSADSETHPPLKNDKSTPQLPDWTHRAMADWATWLVYRNGNAQKQSRGLYYRRAFENVEKQIRCMTDRGVSQTARFTNIPG